MSGEVPVAQPDREAAVIETDSKPSMVFLESTLMAASVETMVAAMAELMPTEMPTVQSTVVAAVVADAMAAMASCGVGRCRRQDDCRSGDRHGTDDSTKSR